MENVVVIAAVAILGSTYRFFRFSNVAYTLLFVFLVLHEVGAHYTYSEVPYDAWARTFSGRSLNSLFGWQRNHYDRFVHFSYGALIFPLAWDLYSAYAPPRGIWRYIFPVTFIWSHSVVYELIEWLAAEVFGGDLGVAYLGAQGDPWDAQKDMALAAAGALLALMIGAIYRRLSRRVR